MEIVGRPLYPSEAARARPFPNRPWPHVTERRTTRTVQADDTLFPGARQAFRLRRDVGDLDGAWRSKEIVYDITSLPAEAAGPAHLNHYERAHWGVENRLHWVRDVNFREDHSPLRTGTAPRALASFRNRT